MYIYFYTGALFRIINIKKSFIINLKFNVLPSPLSYPKIEEYPMEYDVVFTK